MSNIVIANFVVGRNVTTRSLFQYNKGMKLRFANIELPETYRVDFSNSLHGTSKSMVGHNDGVEIPYEYFIPGENIYAWIVTSREENETVTEYQVKIPVDPRAEPTDTKPSENQINFIDQTIAALNAGVSQVETTAERVKEIHENIQETVNSALQEAKDSGQFDGEDGFSPEVTVAPIQGGHRIAITDANGTHTVDVLDGEKGDAGRGIVSVQKTGTVALVDTYTITYTDSTTSTFTVTNGQNGTPGTDGVTFTPVVSAEGVISWTNDGGKTNPQSVNIKGPQGPDGTSPTVSVADISGGHRVTVTDANGTRSFDVMDGDDYVLTAADKAEIAQQAAEEVDVPVQDVQVNGVSVLQDGVANVPVATDAVSGVARFHADYGLAISGSNPVRVISASSARIKAGVHQYTPIVPYVQHESTFYGLAKAAGADMKNIANTTVGTYPDAQKEAIQSMLGITQMLAPTNPNLVASQPYAIGDVFAANGHLYKATAAIEQDEAIIPDTNCVETTMVDAGGKIKDVQVAGSSVVGNNGVANIKIGNGLRLGQNSDHALLIAEPSVGEIRNGSTSKVLRPSDAGAAVFYGLAKVAGDTTQAGVIGNVGTYTDSAKTAIKEMLGVQDGLKVVRLI